jgi:cytochrome P450
MSAPTVSFSPSSPAYFADPYPHYAQLRAENPIHFTSFGFWIVTRYDDVVAGYRDPRLSRDTRQWEHFLRWRRVEVDGPLETMMANWLVMIDPPRHTALRAIHEQVFTPALFAAAEPVADTLVAELLTPARAAGGCDLVPEFAQRLPVYLLNHLLGLPRADWEALVGWSQAIAATSEAQLTRKVLQAGAEAQEAMYAYFRPLIDRRRHSPGDDLVSALAHAGSGDLRLTTQELLDSLIFLYQAGHPTGTQLIALAVHSLLRHPDQLERLRDEPGLIPGAVEELQRYDGPVQMNDRVATADVDLPGVTVRKGELVRLCLASANRDESAFPGGDRLDVGRASTGQLGYGHGLHHCVGAALGRIQTRSALAALTGGPVLRPGEGRVRYLPSTSNRGLMTLPVEL